jgi:hypothetical protein
MFLIIVRLVSTQMAMLPPVAASTPPSLLQRYCGAMLGSAIGDAIGICPSHFPFDVP